MREKDKKSLQEFAWNEVRSLWVREGLPSLPREVRKSHLSYVPFGVDYNPHVVSQ